MFYVNTYQGFIPDRAVVPKHYEFVTDVMYARGFESFDDAEKAAKECLGTNCKNVQYYTILSKAAS